MGVVFDEMGVIAYKITDVSLLHKLRKNSTYTVGLMMQDGL